ncbi:MAG: hypothetical protein AAGJ18_27245 [Bacteroidota bacterium]
MANDPKQEKVRSSRGKSTSKRGLKNQAAIEATAEERASQEWKVVVPGLAVQQIKSEWEKLFPDREFSAQAFLAELLNGRHAIYAVPTTPKAPPSVAKAKMPPPPRIAQPKVSIKPPKKPNYHLEPKVEKRDWVKTALWIAVILGVATGIYFLVRYLNNKTKGKNKNKIDKVKVGKAATPIVDVAKVSPDLSAMNPTEAVVANPTPTPKVKKVVQKTSQPKVKKFALIED